MSPWRPRPCAHSNRSTLREDARRKGNLLHKQSGRHALTKTALRQLVDDRDKLLGVIQVWSSDIPTTQMQWNKEGFRLQWIIRQMSW